MNSAVADYYASLDSALAPLRERGELRMHFGVLSQVPHEYSWLEAALEPDRHPIGLRAGRQALDELDRLVFGPLERAPRSRILDVGAGYGANLLGLARRFPDSECSGLNPQIEQRAVLDALPALPNLRWIGLEFLEFRGGKFDLIYFLESAFHIADKERLLERVSQSLAPGGELWLVDVVLSERLGDAWNGGSHGAELFHYVSTKAWCELGRQHGLFETERLDLSAGVARFLTSGRPRDLNPLFERVAERTARPGLVADLSAVATAYARLRSLLEAGFLEYVVLRLKKAAE